MSMRNDLVHSPPDHVVLVGTGETAMAALWRLCAAGAHIRWYADCADVGEEAILAHALGGGRVELSFDDPLGAPLAGTTAIVIASGQGRDLGLAERARAGGVPVNVAGRPELSAFTLADLGGATRPAWPAVPNIA
jgi:siroheme synthase (precorrin-2 oxidase/ferrochelatase)